MASHPDTSLGTVIPAGVRRGSYHPTILMLVARTGDLRSPVVVPSNYKRVRNLRLLQSSFCAEGGILVNFPEVLLRACGWLFGQQFALQIIRSFGDKDQDFCFLDDAILVVCADSLGMSEDLLAFSVLYIDIVDIWIQYPQEAWLLLPAWIALGAKEKFTFWNVGCLNFLEVLIGSIGIPEKSEERRYCDIGGFEEIIVLSKGLLRIMAAATGLSLTLAMLDGRKRDVDNGSSLSSGSEDPKTPENRKETKVGKPPRHLSVIRHSVNTACLVCSFAFCFSLDDDIYSNLLIMFMKAF
ncbi:hypothetical protein B296_00041235 [Ensete ventricosum]|uniref:Uncharacterized protein n=1 Tax=Ensete ventricosum TaxID=4639 RepID=A0A426ZMF3_ENSVE|nr:hypothetical protein B296_00041235 [Ensete ventricosum]